MTEKFCFIGDVHGNLSALEAMLKLLESRDSQRTILLGDYLNKGKDSKEVIELLLWHNRDGRLTCLRGNHEEALLRAIDRRDLGDFLRHGGAATVRSYVKGDVGPSALKSFLSAFPAEHLEFIRSFEETFETEELIAGHELPNLEDERFRIAGHQMVGEKPVVEEARAIIDTGCGSPGGRLTAFLWPERKYVQVDNSGRAIPSGS